MERHTRSRKPGTTAAKLLARFPIVGEYLADGRLSDRTLVELRDVLEEERLLEILDRAAGRTVPRREPVEQSHEVAAAAPHPAQPTRPPARLEPIAPELHVLRVTVSGAFKADLEEVRQELSHKLPGASIEELLHECMRVTLDACKRRRRGAGVKTTAKEPPRGSPYIPTAFRPPVSSRQAWAHDGGKPDAEMSGAQPVCRRAGLRGGADRAQEAI